MANRLTWEFYTKRKRINVKAWIKNNGVSTYLEFLHALNTNDVIPPTYDEIEHLLPGGRGAPGVVASEWIEVLQSEQVTGPAPLGLCSDLKLRNKSLSKSYEPKWELYQNNPMVYIRVPKTGSTSVIEYPYFPSQTLNCGQTAAGHMKFSEIQRFYDFDLQQKSVVWGVVRNPFDWLVSYYSSTPANHKSHGPYWHHNTSFTDWIKLWVNDLIKIKGMPDLTSFLFFQLYASNSYELVCEPDHHSAGSWNGVFPHPHINHDKNICQADIIIRFERLAEGWHKFHDNMWNVSKTCQSHQPLARERKGKRGDYKDYYTPETRQMIEKHCAEELKLFGYDFDGPTDDSIFINPNRCRRK